MRYIGIDPGPDESGVAVWRDGKIHFHGILPNDDVLRRLAAYDLERPNTSSGPTTVVIEIISSFGMVVGIKVFRTCFAIGKFQQAWSPPWAPRPMRELIRQKVKTELCGTPRAGNPEVRQALINLLGEPGKKAAPGPTFGIKSHEWSAIALCVVAEMLDARSAAA